MMRKIPVSVPYLGEDESRAASEAVLSGWVTQGPRVQAFEDIFASYTGAPFACAVSSCTTALHMALIAVGVRPGDVVITVSHSFIATANAIRHCWAEPVFTDIEPGTFNMHPQDLARCLAHDFEERDGSMWYKQAHRIAMSTSPLHNCVRPFGRLGAILVVHQVGMPANLAEIIPLANKYRVPLVEDAACAIGSEIYIGTGNMWEKIGRPHGDIACFSFHPRKVITTGDGGMLTTSNPEYDRLFRLLRQHGMSISDAVRHQADNVIFEDYLITGYNYRMTDIQAAVGVEQMKRLPDIIRRRRSIASKYRELLSNEPQLELSVEPPYAKSNWQSFIVRLKDAGKQKSLMQALQNLGISTKRGIMCSHLESPYANAWPAGCLPESESARDSSLILPLYPGMADEDIHTISSSLLKILNS